MKIIYTLFFLYLILPCFSNNQKIFFVSESSIFKDSLVKNTKKSLENLKYDIETGKLTDLVFKNIKKYKAIVIVNTIQAWSPRLSVKLFLAKTPKKEKNKIIIINTVGGEDWHFQQKGIHTVTCASKQSRVQIMADFIKTKLADLEKIQNPYVTEFEKMDFSLLKVNNTQKSKSDNNNYVKIKGGWFEMGDRKQNGYQDFVHKVWIDDFYMDQYEVTVGMFEKFIKSTQYKTTAEQKNGAFILKDGNWQQQKKAFWQNPHFPQDDSHPVVCISWIDAVQYCNWLSVTQGLNPCYSMQDKIISCDFRSNGYRLPTEAEWEYAARGGTKSKDFLYSGSNKADEVAWYKQNSNGQTHPGGKKKPNELGLYDLSGNAAEWCWDRNFLNYYRNSPEKNPTGPDKGTYRVIRGGTWYMEEFGMRTDLRDMHYPPFAGNYYGFRLVRSMM